MMRKTSTVVVAAVSLFVAMPLTAQEHTWDRNRPDGHAPIGLLSDVTLSAGDVMFSYRYSRDSFQGLRLGSDLISFDAAFDFEFTVVPAELTVETHEAELRLGLTDDISISGLVPFRFKQMTNLTDGGTSFYITDSSDLGDVEVRLLVDLFEIGEYRAHLSVGGSAPTGEIADRDLTPQTFPRVTQLPFSMQNGSGTWDILPALAFSAQNEFATVGAQAEAVIRMGSNDRNYTLGNRFGGTVWASYMLNEWLSASARVVFETWEDVDGADAATDGNADVSANPFATGGKRTSLPLGFNVLLREGPLAGVRLAVEWQYVISENLNGPQQSQNNGLTIGWQVTF
jgi:hypothetical protein